MKDKIRFDIAGFERMIIDETGNVGIGIAAPIGDLHVDRDKGVVFEGTLNTLNPGPPPIEGLGVRMTCYPEKAAFRVREVTISRPTVWNADNVGFNSVAMGIGTVASNRYCFHLGNSKIQVKRNGCSNLTKWLTKIAADLLRRQLNLALKRTLDIVYIIAPYVRTYPPPFQDHLRSSFPSGC